MFFDAADIVFKYYELPDASVTFLGQSENTSFRVETDLGDKFLLRIHTGVYSHLKINEIWRDPLTIESEMLWLDALARETNLIIPRPVKNNFGKWATTIIGTENNQVTCSLLRWVEGQHLDRKITAERVRQLGFLMAKLHKHSSIWSLPPSFSRPVYDAHRLGHSMSQLAELLTSGTISAPDCALFEKAVARIQDSIYSLPQTSDVWGLIHADLHDGNYLFYNEQARPIDFSRCGFGFYLFDVAMSLNFIPDKLHRHLIEGYTSVRELAQQKQYLETFFIAAIVENFACLSSNSEEHKGLSQAVPEVIKNYVQPYLENKSFLCM